MIISTVHWVSHLVRKSHSMCGWIIRGQSSTEIVVHCAIKQRHINDMRTDCPSWWLLATIKTQRVLANCSRIVICWELFYYISWAWSWELLVFFRVLFVKSQYQLNVWVSTRESPINNKVIHQLARKNLLYYNDARSERSRQHIRINAGSVKERRERKNSRWTIK